MTRTIAFVLLAFALLALPRGSEASETARTQAVSEDEQAIRTIVLNRIEAFNRHEPHQPQSFTPDADFVNVYGMWRRGPAEIEGRQGERMRTVLKEAKITLIELRIRFIRPDVAVVHQLHEMRGMLSNSGERMPPHEELSVRVMVKEQGKWLITAFHNTIVSPKDPPVRSK